MTSSAHDNSPGQPDEGEPDDSRTKDIIDYIDESVASITDADIDDHLSKALRLAGYRERRWNDPDDDDEGDDWRKARGSQVAACVEVGHSGRAIVVRDTVNRQGPTLVLSPASWRALTQAIRAEGMPTKSEVPG